MVDSGISRGLPRWVVLVGGVLLGVGLVAVYVLANLPSETRQVMRASYQRGYEAGAMMKGERSARGPSVRRTPVIPTTS